ncbi:hypothetical protein PENTCL1PPCAC_9632, partial [Pristionchus entomophagus]
RTDRAFNGHLWSERSNVRIQDSALRSCEILRPPTISLWNSSPGREGRRSTGGGHSLTTTPSLVCLVGFKKTRVILSVCSLYEKSELRSAHFDYSIPVTEITPVFVVREYPITLVSLLLNCLNPFQGWVWICIVAGLIIHMSLWPLLARTEIGLDLRSATHRYGDSVWAVFNDWLNGGDHQFILFSGKLLRLIFSVFQRGLLPGIYTGALLAALLAPSDNSPLKSQSDALRLLSTGSYKLIVDKAMWFYQEIVASSDPFFVGLREATRNNNIAITGSYAMVDLVKSRYFEYFPEIHFPEMSSNRGASVEDGYLSQVNLRLARANVSAYFLVDLWRFPTGCKWTCRIRALPRRRSDG